MLPTHALVWSRNEFACRNCERRGRSDEANEEMVNEALAKSELKATLGLEVTQVSGRAGGLAGGEWNTVLAREGGGERPWDTQTAARRRMQRDCTPSRTCVCAYVSVFVRVRCVRVQVKVRGNQCEVDNILTASPAFLCRRIEIGDLFGHPGLPHQSRVLPSPFPR
jgi:hypothetical protein